MTIPNLPTDNLYKFTFLSGLTIIIGSIFLSITQYKGILDKIDATEVSIAKLRHESNTMLDDQKFIHEQLLRLETNIPKGDSFNLINELRVLRSRLEKDKDYREYYGFLMQHKETLFPYQADFLLISKLNEKNKVLADKHSLNKNIIGLNVKFLKREIIILSCLVFFSLFLILKGYKVALQGYNKWLELVQKPSDEKLQLELNQLRKEIIPENSI